MIETRMLPAYETLEIGAPVERVLSIRLNRPRQANALNTQMGRDLLDVFSRVIADPSPYGCVVLTGAGDRAFCGGADLKERRGMSDAAWQEQHYLFERMARSLFDCPLPVIAAVNGAAFAGGCELVLGCDFAYASAGARFALTEVTLGIMPGAGGTQLLPRAIGARRAKELIYTGRPFSAQEAHEWGLVNRLCEPEALMPETIGVAEQICANAPLSIQQVKKSIHFGAHMDMRTAYFFEIEAYNRLVPTRDRREGIDAFNERRKPRYTGS